MDKKEENEVFDEKLFSLIKTILKNKPKATIREVCNRIKMAKEGILYTKEDIENCIDMAIKNGFLITDDSGEIKQADELSAKNIERLNFANEIKVQQNALAENIRKNAEKPAKTVGYFTRKDKER